MSKHHKRGKYSDSLEDEDAMKLARKSSKLHRGDSPSDLSDSEQDDDESLDNSSQDNQTSSSDIDSASDSDEEEADIPLGQLVNIKANGDSSEAALNSRSKALSKSKQSNFKRDSKHRPKEMSSKRPVSVLRDVFQVGKRESRDPRFDSLSARKISDDTFKKRYAFLYDEKLTEERHQLKEALKKVKNERKKEEIKQQLSQVSQQIKLEEQRRKKKAAEKELKSKEKQAVKDGKRPFYLKKTEKKKLELVQKYEELKKTGKLESYMEKRRKKNAAKDHRYLPVGRRGGD